MSSVTFANCVIGHYSPLTSLNSQSKQRHCRLTLVNDKLLWLSTTKTSTLVLPQTSQRTASLRTNALFGPDLLLVAATSPAQSGDITVFLQTSAGLFFLYWVTNFVVPGMVFKNSALDEANEDQKKK